jgi:Tfp pilus assembly protein PilX
VNRLRSSFLRRLLASQDGFALVLALGAMIALSAVGTTVVYYTTSNGNATTHVKNDQIALALAESGLAMAYNRLVNAPDPSMSNAEPAESAPAGPIQAEGGTVQYYGSLDAANHRWTLTGVGTVVVQATGATIVKHVRSNALLGSATRGDSNNAIWNYVYADALTGCTSLGNSVNINVPLYVRGNLCMANSAKVTSYAVQVGGMVTMSSSQNSIGTSSTPLHDIHVAGGCSTDGAHYHKPCSQVDRVYGSTVDANTSGLTKPPVDMPGTYASATLGPQHGCTVGSPPAPFDNNSTPLDISVGTIDLVPKNKPYDCKALDANGNIVGRLAWDGNGTLAVLGTIFFDGNISMTQLNNVVYQGKATIYTSGTITISNHTSLCGVVNCDTNWDVSKNLLAFVAGAQCPGDGSRKDSFSIDNFSTFQGAIYTVCDYGEGNNTTVWGPIISRQLYIQNSTTNFYVPIGTPLPGMPATYDQVVTVAPEPGSWGT